MYAIFLADVLKQAGLKVIEHDGWKTRGRAELSSVAGVLCHHTAGPSAEAMIAKNRDPMTETPALNLVLNGRADLPGPLSQLYLARNGNFHVLAAGRCNHAGAGKWREMDGNSDALGIEAENAGDGKDPWPAVQTDAYAKGVAAILKHLRLTYLDCAGHKEYATPKGRKIDPSFDMNQFRELVRQHMGAPQLQPVNPAHAMLKRGDRGPDVVLLQTKLGITADGNFGPKTEAALKAFQRAHNLTPDGLVGPKTWAVL